MNMRRSTLAASALLALAACHSPREDPRAVTPDEQRQLNDAAAALDANAADTNDDQENEQ